MGRARIGLSENLDPRFLAKAMLHSQQVHGDQNPHADCEECRRLALECLQAKGLTPEDVHELIDAGVDERHQEGAEIFMQMFPKQGYVGSAWD